MSSAVGENAALNKHQAGGTNNIFGFWVYLMTDCLLFASLFATFAVLRNNTFGGSSGQELFSLPFVLTETLLLLTSSFTCGLALLAARKGLKKATIGWFALTFALGLAFLVMEINEFSNLVQDGDSWRASGFLSAFFTLVGTHGLHITTGLIWMAVLIPKIANQGFSPARLRKLTMLGLFWHFLDIVWIFIFSIVYLMGVL